MPTRAVVRAREPVGFEHYLDHLLDCHPGDKVTYGWNSDPGAIVRVANYRADVWIAAPDANPVYHTPACLSDITDVVDGPGELECFMPSDASSDAGGNAPQIPPAPTRKEDEDKAEARSESTASEEIIMPTQTELVPTY